MTDKEQLFTQEELNSHIAKAKGEFKAKATELETQLAQAKAEADAAREKAESALREAAVIEVSTAHNLKSELREFLTANTREELAEQAAKLAANISPVAPKTPSKQPENDGWTIRP